ncbi:hypothetical protein [Streptomyces sp. NPDC088847]|uniref:hypothetical protein n=1 Tax=Streptomyces sp. NPDC088847 TaxID=3365909 RepID=UPI0038273354
MTFRVLTSFHYFRDRDMADLVDQLRQGYGGDVDVFADSGAFSAVTLGATISLPDYRAWLTDWRSVITTAATLDVIGDPVTTARNTEALEASGLTVLPTFHVGTRWRVLEDLCARYRYLALGGMVPYWRRPKELMRWLVHAFRIARDTGTVFHGFGQTSLDIVKALPFYSVDSSTWASGARYGKVRIWDDVRAHMTELQAGDRARTQRYAAQIQAHGADPLLVGRTGFATRTPGKSDEQFYREDHMMRGSNGVAYHRLGQFLARRHQVAPPPGWDSAGTCLYLADTHFKNFTPAAAAVGAHTRKDTPT